MKLFQSFFGAESRGRYPESLLEMAIERAVDGTDPRLRLLPGYRKRLREPVIHAIDHVVALVDAIPEPVPAGRADHGAEPRLAALFSSADEMLQHFSQEAALAEFMSGPGGGAERVTALLLAERVERHILGMELVGDQVQRDVPQVTVSFTAHRLLDPNASEAEMRRLLKRRAFDHLLVLALTRIAEARVERTDLVRQRDLLRRKLQALERGGWTFEAPQEGRSDPAALVAELDAITEQLAAIGVERDVLPNHLSIVAELLGDAEHQLWSGGIQLHLDRMNIQRDARDPLARLLVFGELNNARGRRVVMLPVEIRPADLPAREDFVAAAERYLR